MLVQRPATDAETETVGQHSGGSIFTSGAKLMDTALCHEEQQPLGALSQTIKCLCWGALGRGQGLLID